MVGTFYSAPKPGASRSSPSARVDEETDVCIIEAMKVFNNIKADVPRHDRQGPRQDGQTVEFGQPLFLVKPCVGRVSGRGR